MAKKIDYTLDEFGFDTEFDDLDFDFDAPPVKDDRNPVTKVITGFGSGVKDTIASESFIKESIKSLMPRGYGTGFDAITDTRDSIRDLYNTTADEIRPVVNDLKRVTSKAIPIASRYMPGALAKRLESWAETATEEYRGYSKSGYEDEEINRNLTEIFKIQAEDQEEKDEDEEYRDQLKEGLAFNRHRDQLGQLNQMRLSLSQLVSYQDKITANYQRKSLELQYRHFFLARESLLDQRKHYADQKAYLESINKNTALPEYVKLKQTERLGEALRNRFISSGLTGLFGDRSNFIQEVGGRLRSKVSENLKGIASGLRMGLSTAGTGLEGIRQDREMGMTSDPYSTAGELAGAITPGTIAGSRIGNRLREYISKNEGVAARGNQLQYHLQNIPQYAQEWARGSAGSFLPFGISDFIVNPLKDTILSGAPGRHVDVDNIKNLQEPGIITRQTTKTINEVIPGLLSRIHHELQVIRTGDTSLEPINYDFVRNKFDVQSKVRSNIVHSVINPAQKEILTRNVEELLDQVDPNKTLDKEARQALGKQLLLDNMNNRMASPERLTSQYTYQGDAEKYASEYSQLFQNYFADDENYAKRAGFSEKYNELGRFINIDRGQIQNIVNAGLADSLSDAGILSLGGPDVRDPAGYLDFAKYFNYYYGDTYTPTKDLLMGGVNRLETPPSIFSNIERDEVDSYFTGLVDAYGRPIRSITQDPVKPQEPTNVHKGLLSDTPSNRNVDDCNCDEIIATIKSISPIELLIQANRTLESIDQKTSTGLPIYNLNDLDPEKLKQAIFTTNKEKEKEKETLFRRSINLSKDIGSSLYSKSKIAGKLINDTAGEVVRGVGTSLHALGGISDRITSRGKELTDIYLGGSDQPVLEAWKLKAGHYRDEATNKVITNFRDIKGNILDPEGNVTLKAEDIQYAFSRTRSGVKSLTSLGAGKIESGMRGLYDRLSALDLRNTGLFAKSKETTLSQADSIYDVYTKDKLEPILQDWKLKAGYYRDSVTGEILKSFKNIKNPVMEDGKVIATLDDLKEAYTKTTSGIKPLEVIGGVLRRGKRIGEGITNESKQIASRASRGLGVGRRWLFDKPEAELDAEGNKVSEPKSRFERGTSGLFDVGKMGINLFGKAGDFLGRGVAEGISNFTKFFTSALGQVFSGRKIVDRLDNLYKLLDDRLPGRKIRKGSYEDQMNEKNKKEEEEENSANANMEKMLGSAWSNSIFGMGAGALGSLLNRNKDKEKDDSDDSGSIAGSAAAGAVAGGLGSKILGGLGRAGRWGLRNSLKIAGIGSAAYAGYNMLNEGVNLGDIAMLLGGLATTGFGRAAMMGVGKGALAAGGALLSAVSAPVLLGGAAIAGAGYLGYRYFTRKKPEPLSTIRYAQYGFLPGDDDRFRKILQFEDVIMKTISIKGSQVQIDPQKFNSSVKEITDIFGINMRNEAQIVRWGEWFSRRFKPIFLTYVGELNKIDSNVNIADVDNKLSDKDKLLLIDRCTMDENPYQTLISPFPNEESLPATIEHINKYISDARGEIDPDNTGSSSGETGFFGKIGSVTKSIFGLLNPLKLETGGEDPAKTLSEMSFLDRINPAKSFIPSLRVVSKGIADFINPKIGDISKLRMMQYGLDPNDTELIKKIMQLDNQLSKFIINVETNPKLEVKDKATLEKVYSVFGIDYNNSRQLDVFRHWFENRYTPVLIEHIKAFKTIRKPIDFINIDNTLSKNEKVEYIQIAVSDTLEYIATESPVPNGKYIENNKAEINDYKESILSSLKSVGADDKIEKVKGLGIVEKAKGLFDRFKDKLFGDKKDTDTSQNTQDTKTDTTGPTKNIVPPITPSGSTNVNPNATMSSAGLASRSGHLGRLDPESLGNVPQAGTRPLKGDGAANSKMVINLANEMGITNKNELAMLLAQLDHESSAFTRLEENLRYSASRLLQVFPKYVKSRAQAEQLAKDGAPAIGSLVYGNRMGNNGVGEGYKYRGRGFIQLTGKENYTDMSRKLGIDLINNPDQASVPEIAAKIAVQWWKDRPRLVSAGRKGDVSTATKIINGGFNGLSDRRRLYAQYTNMDMNAAVEEAKKFALDQASTSEPAIESTDTSSVPDDSTPTSDVVVPSVTSDPVTQTTGYDNKSPIVPKTEVEDTSDSVPPTTYSGYSPTSTVPTRQVAEQQKQNAVDNTAIFKPIHDSMNESVRIGSEHLSVSKQSLEVQMKIVELMAEFVSKGVPGKHIPTDNPSSPQVSRTSNRVLDGSSPVSLSKKYAS